MPISEESSFSVADWRVFPDEDLISRGEQRVRLEPLTMNLLVYLVSRPGEVVSRADIEQEVWRGGLVGYDAVTSTVIKLRKALGDNAKQPSFIATVPKRGYQLIASVKWHVAAEASEKTVPEPEPATRRPWLHISAIGIALALILVTGAVFLLHRSQVPQSDTIALRTEDIPSLAVLPFINLSEDPARRYLTDGLTEDVITGLSRLAGLRVIARNSAFAFAGIETDPREVASQLGVRYVLQGSVRSAGEHMRVTAKLIDTESGVHLWAEQFDGGVQDLFALQDRVAERTATALSVELSHEESRRFRARPTTSSGAYDFYLRGRVIYGSLSERESELARSMYRRALEEDPNFALAYAGLAFVYIDDFRNEQGPDSAYYADEAARLAERAVTLDQNLPQAHFALGFVALYGRSEHERAKAAAKQALALDPNYADAYALLSSAYFFAGELSKTVELDREAMRLNPASSFIYDNHIGRRNYLEGHYQDALDAFKIAASKNYNFVPTHVWLAATYAKLGDIEEAEWAAHQVRTLEPEFSIEEWTRRRPYKKAEHREHLVTGLRVAGLK